MVHMEGVEVRPAVASKTIRKDSNRSSGSVVWFVVLAYALAWGWAVPIAVSGGTVEQGQGWPTHVPSLMAPLLASIIVTGFSSGRAGMRDLIRRMVRWRFTFVWWLIALSPAVVGGLTLLVLGLAGQDLPGWNEFSMFNGLPAFGAITTLLLILLLNGFGEETGWRGFLQDRLQRRFKPLPATLIVGVVWAVWHTPFFFILSTYAEFTPTTLVMFPLGLVSGAVILAWLYNHTGYSIFAVALWHTLYNMVVATGGATDLVQGVVTATVMIAASVLVVAEIVVQHRKGGTVLGLVPEGGRVR